MGVSVMVCVSRGHMVSRVWVRYFVYLFIYISVCLMGSRAHGDARWSPYWDIKGIIGVALTALQYGVTT